MENNFPCICGHNLSDHNIMTTFINNENFCKICNFSGTFDLRGMSSCFHKYIPSNLRYLEMKYETNTINTR